MKNKHLFLTILFILFSFNLLAQNLADKNFVIEQATLHNNLQITPCGTTAHAYGFKFTLNYSDSSIIGIIRCPEYLGDNFLKKDSKYDLQLTQNNVADSIKGFSLINLYAEYKFPIYFIIKITKSK